MARVIYTGPLNPIIFARAKKEAEKAERIKGYTPRVIKTPTHTVVYNKTGAEVKAVVMDMMAPITFSIPGSAIPVAPRFISSRQTMIDPQDGYVGKTHRAYADKNADIGMYFFDQEEIVSGLGHSGWLPFDLHASTATIGHQSLYFIAKDIAGGSIINSIDGTLTSNGLTRSDEEKKPVRSEDGNKSLIDSTPPLEVSYSTSGRGGLTRVGGAIAASISGEKNFSYSILSGYIGSYGLTEIFGKAGYADASIEYQFAGLKTSIKTAKDKEFFYTDVVVKNKGGAVFSRKERTKLITDYLTYNIIKRDVYYNSISTASGVVYGDQSVATDCNGLLVVGAIKFNCSFEFDSKVEYHGDDWTFSHKISESVNRQLVRHTDGDEAIVDIRTYNFQIDQSGGYYPDYFDFSNEYSDAPANTNEILCVLKSIGDGGVILISCNVFDGNKFKRALNKIEYNSRSDFVRSHLHYYFDIFNGKYIDSSPPVNLPPKITTDGICLPHAWFFCRGNETRQTDFYPNNHNRLSIVIYPQGRHEFSVDEAEIVSVELNHTPRFVARPGGGIAFVMQSLFGGNKLVPYVVNGLVEERDEYGEPTGFYLAQDGAISGEFKAHPNGGSNPFASFKLSPRQVFDGYRTVTVETTTERKYGVQTTFEVQGSGGVRVQQPPSITLERINESVLAGQSTVFYVTATQIAVGSNLRYEVKRAGVVVSAGYIELGNCAGWVEFIAPFQVVSVPGDPVRYVLGDKSAPSTTPSTVEFEFGLVHEQAPPPVTFSVKFAHDLYASSTDRPVALPMPPLFFLQPLVSENGEDDFLAANHQTTLINRIYYSLQSKRVYVLFWDGQSCDVSGILKQNPESGQYEYNPDWKETTFNYPPAVDPYNIKGTLEPYVYAYMDYEKNRNNGA